MSNINVVKSIGAGERKLAVTADAIVGEDAGTLDKKAARTEATERVWTFVGGKEGAPAQSDKSGKNKTDFGRGFGSLVSAVASRLTAKGDTDWLGLMRQAVTNAHVKGGEPFDTLATIVAEMAIEAARAGELAA